MRKTKTFPIVRMQLTQELIRQTATWRQMTDQENQFHARLLVSSQKVAAALQYC